eukprot:SAG31_NODE_1733_length_7417_cov_1.994397_6_plen_158_part_00
MTCVAGCAPSPRSLALLSLLLASEQGRRASMLMLVKPTVPVILLLLLTIPLLQRQAHAPSLGSMFQSDTVLQQNARAAVWYVPRKYASNRVPQCTRDCYLARAIAQGLGLRQRQRAPRTGRQACRTCHRERRWELVCTIAAAVDIMEEDAFCIRRQR